MDASLSHPTYHLCKNRAMRLFVLCWFALVTAVSLGPLELKIALGTVGAWHNAMHIAVFSITALLGLAGATSLPSRSSRILLLLLFCFLLELFQAWIYHNRYEWRDLYVDSLGLCFGWMATILYRGFSMRKA